MPRKYLYFICDKGLAHYTNQLNPLITGDHLTGNMANSDDRDEMPRNAAFHQCLHSLVKTGKKYIIWNV